MDKIAGPYLHTLTSTLGDKRSTMLESELQYKVGINQLPYGHSAQYTNYISSTKLTKFSVACGSGTVFSGVVAICYMQ